MKTARRSLLLLLTASLLLLAVAGVLTSCDPTYFIGPDESVAIVTVAVRSLPACTASHGGTSVWKLEEDEYGRILFAYLEMGGFTASAESHPLGESIFALCVMQGWEEGDLFGSDQVYYLQGKNVCLTTYEEYPRDNEAVLDCFTDEQIATLKANNDWGQPDFAENMAVSECHDDFSVEGEYAIRTDAFDEMFGEWSCYCPMFATEDGRLAYTVVQIENIAEGEYEITGMYLILLNAAGGIDAQSRKNMVEVTTPDAFPEEFAEFLMKNGLSEGLSLPADTTDTSPVPDAPEATPIAAVKPTV